jgi:lauroyl/myristoyl acyltransferase
MAFEQLESELRRQFRERPYWTTGLLVGAGWVLGRTLPVSSLLAIAGLGARTAVFSSLENTVLGQMRGRLDGREHDDERA